MIERVFSGRIMIDHLPKTAGQAVNSWLRRELGTGVVTGNLIGDHHTLIRRYGGLYSIICSHLSFDGRGLDPRHHYVTCLRDPIDRALSWLYFMLTNHTQAEADPGLWQAVRLFIDSDGERLEPSLTGYISNLYVSHFAAVFETSRRSDTVRMKDAFSAIERYQTVGFYESLPDFLADLAGLLSLRDPGRIDAVNVTRHRPRLADIPDGLRQSLTDLNRLDLEFTRQLRERHHRLHNGNHLETAAAETIWSRYDRAPNRQRQSPDLTLRSVTGAGLERPLARGDDLIFDLDFSVHRRIDHLLVGLHLHDEDGVCTFGTHTALLDKPLRGIGPGAYHITFRVTADLPQGRYSAGFAFVEQMLDQTRDLVWHDRILDFEISAARQPVHCGYSALATSCEVWPAALEGVLRRERGPTPPKMELHPLRPLEPDAYR